MIPFDGRGCAPRFLPFGMFGRELPQRGARFVRRCSARRRSPAAARHQFVSSHAPTGCEASALQAAWRNELSSNGCSCQGAGDANL